jgi:hypothetical protein
MRTTLNAQQRIQRVLHLQQTYGNAYVRRVLIRSGSVGETLYQDYAPGNVNKTTDDYRPNQYGGSARYELTRDTAQNKARVNVRIKFVDQKRLKNAQHSGPKKAIPDNDPRRAWATDMCSKLVGSWNGKFELVSKLLNAAAGGASAAPVPTAAPTPTPAPANNTPATGSGGTPTPAATPTPAPASAAPSTPGEIHLPIEFVATPVWDISSQAFDQEVALYSGEGDVSTGNPVDSGNWYMKTDQNYGGSLQR